jgi:hypothetical protein
MHNSALYLELQGADVIVPEQAIRRANALLSFKGGTGHLEPR